MNRHNALQMIHKSRGSDHFSIYLMSNFADSTTSRSLIRFAAVSAHLRKTSHSRFGERSDVIPLHDFAEFSIVDDRIWTRTHNAHVTKKDVEKSRHFIKTGPSQKTPHGIHPFVVLRGLPGRGAVSHTQRPKIEASKRTVPLTASRFPRKQRPGRLDRLKDLNQNGKRRQNKDQDRQAHQKIYSSLENAARRIFGGVISQTDEISIHGD